MTEYTLQNSQIVELKVWYAPEKHYEQSKVGQYW